MELLGRYGLWLAFLVTLVATLATIYASEVLGMAPCSLCWVQRVFLWPQVVIFGVAALTADRRAALYSIALSLFGAVIALYHHWLQIGGSHFVPCPVNGNAIDCATPTFVWFGFITFPFLAFVLFIFLVLFMTLLRSIWRKSPQEGHA